MNKQALAFLTLFSLILMLSVYYVTLPTDATTTVMNEEGKENTEEQTKENKDSAQESEAAGKEEASQAKTPADDERTSLQAEADKKKDDEISKNSSVVSATDKSEAEKQQALEAIEQQKDAKALQQELAQTLSDSGYMCAVELNDTNCIITVFDQEESKETAKKIMKAVNSKLNQQYSIQVAFK